MAFDDGGGRVQFSEVIERRRSVRKFTDQPVEDDKIDYILEAARSAPSACNHQPTTFIVVRDRAHISAAIGRPVADAGWINKWLADAPVMVVACGDRSRTDSHHGVDFWQIDTAIAAEHLVLAAVDTGLGTCWVGAFDEPAVRAALAIPEAMGIVALLAIGYPAVRKGVHERMVRAYARADTRKPMSEFVRWETW